MLLAAVTNGCQGVPMMQSSGMWILQRACDAAQWLHSAMNHRADARKQEQRVLLRAREINAGQRTPPLPAAAWQLDGTGNLP